MPTLMGTVLPVLVKEGLKEENIEAAIGLILKGGKKISRKVAEYLEKRKLDSATSEGNTENGGIPEDVQKEVEDSLRELMEEQARPVYMGGVAFFFEENLGDEGKETLRAVLTNVNDDTGQAEWEDEQDIACQKTVDDFMWDNYGRDLNENENDYCISDGCLYLNFAFDDYEDAYRIYEEKEIRGLADALNRLLGDMYITKFTVY